MLSENTRQIVDRPGLQPDILITAPGRSPVVVEAEFMPARTAEQEAKDRLGLEVVGTARHIDAAIALRYPEGVEDADDLSAAVSDARLSYCVCYADGTRFPESGWLEGPVEDLADLIRLVSVPQRAVDEAADALEKGIDRAAVDPRSSLPKSRPDVVTNVAGLLGMSEVLQTYRMAGAIVANAMVFHERLAGMHGVDPLSQLCSTSISSPKRRILDAWQQILKINYWPIFAIARDIVSQLPAAEAAQLLSESPHHGRGRRGHGREPGARPYRAHIPAADRGPQVPGDVLHSAGLGGAARAACGREDGRAGLV